MTAEQTQQAPEPSNAEEWEAARARGEEATRQARLAADRVPEGSFVSIDLSVPHARVAVRPVCGSQEPSVEDQRGAYGVLLAVNRGADGVPLSARVQLRDRAQGIVDGIPFAALRWSEYRDTTHLRAEGA